MQGALRSVFLIKAGLSKEAYVATGAAIAFVIDVSRLGVYSRSIVQHRTELDFGLLGAAVTAAFLGAIPGDRYLPKVTMGAIRRIVAALLSVVAVDQASDARANQLA